VATSLYADEPRLLVVNEFGKIEPTATGCAR